MICYCWCFSFLFCCPVYLYDQSSITISYNYCSRVFSHSIINRNNAKMSVLNLFYISIVLLDVCADNAMQQKARSIRQKDQKTLTNNSNNNNSQFQDNNVMHKFLKLIFFFYVQMTSFHDPMIDMYEKLEFPIV